MSAKQNEIQVAITLASLAYAHYHNSLEDQASYIEQMLGEPELPTAAQWKLKWGPVLHEENLMYLVHQPSTEAGTVDRYALAIRGTVGEPLNILEDLDVIPVCYPWEADAPPAGTMLSQGISLGAQALMDAQDGGIKLMDVLAPLQQGGELLVTGHSLGGCLTTVLAMHIACQLPAAEVHSIPFAGQTAGNAHFADWYTGQFGEGARWFNHYDIVPRAWDKAGLESIKTLYPAQQQPGTALRLIIDGMMFLVKDHYAQPGTGTELAGELALGAEISFLQEVKTQHDHLYYMFLVGVEMAKMWPNIMCMATPV